MHPSQNWSQFSDAIDLLESAWKQGTPSDLRTFLPSDLARSTRDSLLKELVKVDLELRWRKKIPLEGTWETEACKLPTIANYRGLYAELASTPDVLIELLSEEFHVRSRWGDRPSKLAFIESCNQQWRAELTAKLADTLSESILEPRNQPLPTIPHHVIESELGRGGMGVVYKARHLQLHREVAIKLVAIESAHDLQSLTRFRHEAMAVAKLDHPSIVKIFDIGEVEGRPYFSMEYIAGTNLHRQVATEPLTQADAAKAIRECALAVEHAHGQGVLHRDIKPQNILMDENRLPRLVDFGLSKMTGEADASMHTQGLLGTPSYMAPEQVAAPESVSTKTDIYALGATLYYALTGNPPFRAASVAETLRQVVEQDPVPPRQFNPRIDRDLETICLHAMHKDPNRRYTTSQHLADDLQAWLERRPISARPTGATERIVRWCRRQPALACMIGLSLLSVLSVFGVLANGWRTEIRNVDQQQGLIYDLEMRLAHEAWQANSIERQRSFLSHWTPRGQEKDRRHWEWHFLQSLPDRGARILEEHQGILESAVFSPNGKWLATSGEREQIILWDTQSWQPVRKFYTQPGAPAQVARNMAWHPQLPILATGSSDHLVRVWNVETSELLHVVEAHEAGIVFVGWNRDGKQLATVADDRALVWDWDSKRLEHTFLATDGKPEPAVRAVLWSKDNQRVATCSDFGQIALWDANTWELKKQRPPSPDGQQHWWMTWDASEKFLVTATQPATVAVWDAEDLHLVKEFRHGTSVVRMVEANPVSGFVASAARDNSVAVWDLVSMQPVSQLRGAYGEVVAIGWSPDGKSLASVGNDKKVRVWESWIDQESSQVRDEQELIAGFDLHPKDGTVAMTGRFRQGLRLASLENQEQAITIPAKVQGFPWFARWNSDGSEVAVVYTDASLRVWNIQNQAWRELIEADGVKTVMRQVAWSPDHKWLATTTCVGSVRLIDARSMRVVKEIQLLQELIHTGRKQIGSLDDSIGLGWSPDSQRLVVSAMQRKGGNVYVIDEPASAAHLQTLSTPDSSGTALAVSHRGDRFAVGFANGNVWVWDMKSLQPIQELFGHGEDVCSIAWSADDQRLATASWDNSVRIWDVGIGIEILKLRPPMSPGERVETLNWQTQTGDILVSCGTRIIRWSTSSTQP